MAFSLTKILKGLRVQQEGTLTPKAIEIVPGGTGGFTTTITSSQASDVTLTLPSSTGNIATESYVATSVADRQPRTYSTTPTAAGTTTLTSSSTYYQFFTGTLTQTVQLPNTTTMVNGYGFEIVNTSTGILTVNSDGSLLVTTVLPGNSAKILVINSAADSNTSWSVISYAGSGANFQTDTFSGDGSTTAFVLTNSPATENNTFVFLSGVYQQKNTYSLLGSTITFSTAPSAGTNNVEINYGTAVAVENGFKSGYGAVVGSAAQVSQNIATHTSIQAVNDDVSVVAGSKVCVLAGTYTENLTLNKELCYEGQGRGSKINGTITCAVGFNYGQLKGFRFQDDVTINSSYNSVTEFWTAPTKTITDNGSSNLILGIGE